MRNLLQFIMRFGGTLLFIVLEVISFYLVVNYNSKQQTVYLTSANHVVGSLTERYESTIDYFNLKNQIKSLMEENAALRKALPSSGFNNITAIDTIYNDSLKQRFTFIDAKVINNSIVQTNNYLTLNRGRQHGVQTHMGVLGPTGVVGIVRASSAHYCSVMSLLHSQTRISAAISRNGYFGSLTWEGGDPTLMNLEAIPKHAVVNNGDTIKTSGYSLFPAGVVIGIIEENELIKGSNYYDIKVRLINDLAKIKHAYIVKDLMREEFSELEQEGSYE